MAHARLAYENVALAATPIASSAASGYPVTNLRSADRWKIWRSTTTTGDQSVVLDLGDATTLSVVALIDWRAHAGGTISAEYWTGAAWAAFGGGSGLFTLPTPNPTGIVVLWAPDGVSTSQIRITFTNVDAVSDYVQLGVLFAGTYVSPAVNLSDGYTLYRQDPSIIVASDSGNESAYRKPRFYVAEGTFQSVSASEKDSFIAIGEQVGTHTPIVCAITPEDPNEIIYGRFTALTVSHVTLSRFRVSVALKEAI